MLAARSPCGVCATQVVPSSSVDELGPYPTPDLVVRLDHSHAAPAPSKDSGALKPGQAGADHQYVDHPAILAATANRFSIVVSEPVPRRRAVGELGPRRDPRFDTSGEPLRPTESDWPFWGMKTRNRVV